MLRCWSPDRGCNLTPGVLQNYFTRVLEDDLKAVIKPQYVDHIPKAVRGNVDEVLSGKDQRGIKPYLLEQLDLQQVSEAGWVSCSACRPTKTANPAMLRPARQETHEYLPGVTTSSLPKMEALKPAFKCGSMSN